MESPDSLTTFAELAIALAGFTGLLTAFQRKQITWSSQERFRIRMLLLVCFGIMSFALIPKVFVDSAMAAEQMWRLPTIGWSLFAIAVCASFVRRIVVGNVQLAMPKSTWLLLISGLVIHLITLAGSSFQFWQQGSAALSVGFIWGLLFGGMFFYATLSIIWKKEDTA
jgi:hypothetical protein